ncbi:SMI1/KNR4 family protein [Clostridium butanoliproducens]|uniref:SMI1/KNR4 family protein n=1 Tax=Clostridium butanoliproducens TaxID=2991837 RepID=UPI0024BA3F79|nr:SMI1/KNR4 family protein [Clostridium butanoliproducens]MDU1351080.1 SMI1/KNR4 family protein [Clostridium argentinense]
MSILKELSNKYRIDASKPASNNKEIEKLVKFSNINIPEDFLEVIRELTDVEINVDGEKYIRIWGADGCIDMNEAYSIQDNIPNSLAIADDEGGNALIYTTGDQGFGIYIIAFNDLDIDELQYVAGSLTELLKNNVGINIITRC